MCYIVGQPHHRERDVKPLDEAAAADLIGLIRRARALGITKEKLEEVTSIADMGLSLRQEVRRLETLANLVWHDKYRAQAARRRRIAAAYLAGASLRQLAYLFNVRPESIATLVKKELPQQVRERVAQERTARGRR